MPESKRISRTDWAKVDATTDEDIARQIAEDPDTAPEWTAEDFDRAEVWNGNKFLGHGRDFKGGRKVGRPKGSGTKELVSLRLDRAILDHFRAGGPGWQTRLNDALLAGIKPLKVGDKIGSATLIAIEPLTAPGGHRERLTSRKVGTNARLIVEVLREMPSGVARPADIRKALQSDKGVSMAFTSIRRALGQLADREEVTSPDKGETWRYIGESA
ncbi:MAG TPA: BrnA antitoxin family protein [Stellaceae bacterium]|jgi:uncharacterized protein (DUF4415 family)|nr:BrnA antitoxin family protein [Stellaceae bacterium]